MTQLREDNLAAHPGPGDEINLPDPPGSRSGYHGDDSSAVEERSLLDDVAALLDDARTYLDAELSYQKTRAAFVSDRLKKAAVFGVGAGVIGLVAFIGLTVGLIIALTPLLTAWGATAVVVGLLLLVSFVLVKKAARNWNSMMGVVRSNNADHAEG